MLEDAKVYDENMNKMLDPPNVVEEKTCFSLSKDPTKYNKIIEKLNL